MKEVVTTTGAPAALGPYSQAIKANGFVFSAGQIPIEPATGEVVGGDITAQTERVMKNLEAVLAAAGSSFDRVVRTTVYLTDLADFAAMNEVYARYFPAAPPARSTVQISGLARQVRVEIDVIAIA